MVNIEKQNLLSFYGGKVSKVKTLVRFLPPHDAYIEVCGGMASLLFYKYPSKIEVYNDKDKNIVNFFRVLRDQSDKFLKKLVLTPYSREEFARALIEIHKTDDDIERARIFAIITYQSMNSRPIANCSSEWSFSKGSLSRVIGWNNLPEKLKRIVERLKNVQIECDDFEKIITRYDNERTVMYVDPPYIGDTRTLKKRYAKEMTNQDYERLIQVLLNVKNAKIILSGYNHPLYDKLINKGWNIFRWNTRTSCDTKKRNIRTEMIFFNFNLLNIFETGKIKQ